MKKHYFLFSIIFLLIILSNTNAQWVQTNGPGNGMVMALAKNDSILYAGIAYSSSPGVFITTNNGQNWSQPYYNRTIYSLAAYGQYVFAGVWDTGDSGTYRSTNYGQTWSLSFLDQAFSLLTFNSGGIPYVFLGKNTNFLSTDNGVTWVSKPTYCSYIGSYAKSGTTLYAGMIVFACGVEMSTNNGESWQPIGLNNHNVLSLAVNNSYLFAGTSEGVYLTSNNGQNWIQSSLNNQTIHSLTLNYSNIIAGTDNGVYFSTNNGANWIQKNEGMGNQTIQALLFKSNYLFAGAGNGYVYRRQFAPNVPTLTYPPNGATGISLTPHLKWYDFSFAISYRVQLGTDSLFNSMVLDTNVGYFPTNDSLIVPPGILYNNTTYYWHINATDTGTSDWSSTWHFTTGTVGISKISDAVPKQFALYQNYPNPFNPSTKIKFQIPKLGGVQLKVFDVLGREVGTLVNENLSPGTYEIEWDRSSYASGVYFYKLEAGDYNQTKKMVIIK